MNHWQRWFASNRNMGKVQHPNVVTIENCNQRFKPIETRPVRTQLTRKNNDCVNEKISVSLQLALSH